MGGLDKRVINGMTKKQITAGIIPAKMAISPLDTAAFTFCVAAIATIIGIYIWLQNCMPLPVVVSKYFFFLHQSNNNINNKDKNRNKTEEQERRTNDVSLNKEQ